MPSHGWQHPGYWHWPAHHDHDWLPPVFVPAPAPPSSDYLCRGNFEGLFNKTRDAYLSMDDSTGELLGQMILEEPETVYDIEGGCEQTDDGYANVWFTLVPGGLPYYGSIYVGDDGQVYVEGTQDQTGYTFVLQRTD